MEILVKQNNVFPCFSLSDAGTEASEVYLWLTFLGLFLSEEECVEKQ